MYFDIGGPVFETLMVALKVEDCDDAAMGDMSSERRQAQTYARDFFKAAEYPEGCIERHLLSEHGAI
ncbi:MAG: hypothetical protein WBY53_06835 [Acidobacteriaceae bacterium]